MAKLLIDRRGFLNSNNRAVVDTVGCTADKEKVHVYIWKRNWVFELFLPDSGIRDRMEGLRFFPQGFVIMPSLAV